MGLFPWSLFLMGEKNDFERLRLMNGSHSQEKELVKKLYLNSVETKREKFLRGRMSYSMYARYIKGYALNLSEMGFSSKEIDSLIEHGEDNAARRNPQALNRLINKEFKLKKQERDK